MFSFTLFFALVAATQASYWLNCYDYEEGYRALDQLISHKPYLIPPLVRLAFHDCLGHSCDGCVNFDDPGHGGLADPIKEIDHLWEDYHWDFKHHFSRSDWWQLASHVALIRGGLNRQDGHKDFFYLQYWWGRYDCHTSPGTYADDNLPDAGKDWHDVWATMHGVFGLDYEETVAILGAHSLGGAHSQNSGYKFNWQKNYLTFDNTYFKNLLYLPYTHEEQSEGSYSHHKAFVWYPHDHHEQPLLMLHTDMCLRKDIKSLPSYAGGYSGDVACYLENGEPRVIPDGHENFVAHCQDSYTSDIVHHFAHDLKDFYSKFSHAWWKIVSHGYQGDKLKLPGNEHEKCGHCIPHGAYCVPGFELSGSCCHGHTCIDHKCQ